MTKKAVKKTPKKGVVKKVAPKKTVKRSVPRKVVKAKTKPSKLIHGAILGAVLGVAAGMMVSRETKNKLKGSITVKYAEFNKFMAPQLKKLKNISEKDYKLFVDKTIKSFSNVAKLTKKEADELAKLAKDSWKRFNEHGL